MFSNFEKAFKKNFIDVSIPSEVIDALSEKLPPELSYENIGNGACIVKINEPKDMLISVGLELPKGIEFKSKDELLYYMYRTQTELKIKPDQEGCISINGIKIHIEDLVKFPLDARRIIHKDLTLCPEPFQPPFELEIEGGGIKRKVMIKREPYADLKKSLFKVTNSDDIFTFSYILDEENKKLNFNFSINIEKSNNAREILNGLILYNACLKGNFAIGGSDKTQVLVGNLNLTVDNEIEQTIMFWDKITMIEKELGVVFQVEFPITEDDALWIEKLYRAFVEKKAYKEYAKVENININANKELDREVYLKPSGLTISMTQKLKLELWKAHINTFDSVALYNLKVTDILLVDKEKLEYKLVVEGLDSEKISLSTRHFLSEDEAKEYLKQTEDLLKAELLVLS